MLGETLGYVKNKSEIEQTINDYINSKEGNLAFVEISAMPEYEFRLTQDIETNEEDVLLAVKENSKVTYKLYAISLDGENKQYVNTMEEAETVVAQLKEKYKNIIELNLGVSEYYTQDLENVVSGEITIAETKIEEDVKQKVEIKSHSVNGVYLSKPVKGVITSRYGTRSSGYHSGLDIATSTGTAIYACAAGKVTCASYNGSYGNLVKISHGDGVETWYAHCSAIYVSVGETVTAETKIAAVGSTGNSTGSHLHLEIRLNGVTQNPQNYLYK